MICDLTLDVWFAGLLYLIFVDDWYVVCGLFCRVFASCYLFSDVLWLLLNSVNSVVILLTFTWFVFLFNVCFIGALDGVVCVVCVHWLDGCFVY